MTIISIDRPTAKHIATEIETALADVAQRLGVKITVGGTRFTEQNAKIKIEVATISSDGQVRSEAAENFGVYAYRYGLKPEDMGKTFSWMGNSYEISGCSPRSHKYPILAKRLSDGKTYKFAAKLVREGI